MSRRATINSVAERAGVSRGTVDRVLNQRPHVRPDIYDRVVKAMRELDYIPPTEQQAEALGLTRPLRQNCRLGVLLPHEQGYFRDELMRGISDARSYLHMLSVEVVIEECETDLPDESVEKLEALAQKEVSGIVMRARDHSTVAEKINELHERHIPVITFNSDIENCQRLCFVGQDLVRGGRIAGELMSKLLRPDDRFLIVLGNPEFKAHRQRLQGFCERLHEKGFRSGNFEVVETYNDHTLTYQKVRDALAKTPDLRGIYMANLGVAGCAEAIREAGKQGQVHIICHDLTESARRLLLRGEIDFVLTQNIYRQGYASLTLLYDYLQNHKIPDPENDPPAIDIICCENIAGRA